MKKERKEQKKKMKQSKFQKQEKKEGITLVALVITMIVLLILAGITITLTIGQSGIITRAQEAGKNYLDAQDQELAGLNNLDQEASNIIAGNGIGENVEKDPNTEIVGNGSFIYGVNTPKLGDNMTAIVYDGTSPANGNIPEGWKKVSNEAEWYNYNNQQWANAVTEDGSMWVWIPRYEYKITGQTIDIHFIPTSTTQKTGGITEGYRIHPAFEDGSETGKNNHYMNGEWDSELAGIWVAKFEASRQDSTSSTMGSGNTIKIQPNVKSWRSIGNGDSYANSMNMYPEYNSHLIKNSEWGAVAYLTESKYGRNGTEVSSNNEEYLTGGGDYKTNTSQSSTGNCSGIYDLNGGANEMIAAYITNGHPYLNQGKTLVATTTKDPEGYKTLSTKYATVYPFDSSSDGNANNWNVYNGLKSDSYGYGDAILETSTSGKGNTSWHEDQSNFPNKNGPFFRRSGIYYEGQETGIFNFHYSDGIENDTLGFRVVMIIL